MERVKNVAQLLVAKDIARTDLSALTTAPLPSITELADGEIVQVDAHNRLVSTGGDHVGVADVERTKFVQRSGDQWIESDVIDVHSIKEYHIETYTAATQQIDYIGYGAGAASASLDVVNDNTYSLKLHLWGNNHADFAQKRIVQAFYESSSSALEKNIAEGLVEGLIANTQNDADDWLLVERVNSGAGTALDSLTADTGTITVTEGSVWISAATDIDGGGDVVAGTFIRFGTTDTTDPVYEIVEVDSANDIAKLDVPYQAASGTFASNAAELITVAGEGSWGIKLTGQARTLKPGFYNYEIVRWAVNADFADADAPTVTNAQAPSDGIGTYGELASLEKQLQGEEFVYRAFPEQGVTERTDVLSTETYDVMIVEYEDSLDTDIGGVAKSPKQLIIAVATTAAQADVAEDGFVTTMDAWAVTSWAIPGLSVQTGNLTA